MSDHEHIIERRARMLAGKLKRRKEILIQAFMPAGARLPFTEQLSVQDALAFWRENRHTADGRRILSAMKPEDVLELDIALAQMTEPTGT